MTEKQFIKKDYIWNTIGVFAQNAISPLLLLVITRINGIYDSGLFSFAFSIAILFWALGMWGGRTYQVSDTKKEFSQKSYILLRLYLAITMLIIVVIFVLLNHYDIGKASILISLVVLKATESIADVLYGIMQIHHRLYYSGKSLLAKALVGIALFVITDLITGSILYGSLGLIVTNLLILLLYDLPIANKFTSVLIQISELKVYTKEAVNIAKRCSAVFAVTFLAMFALNIPRYFIDLFHQNEIGYFGIIAMPITLIALFMNFILQPKVVNLSVVLKEKRIEEFKKIIRSVMFLTLKIGIIVVIITATIGAPILQLLFGVDFSAYWLVLVVMVMSGVVNALVSVFISVLVIMRQIKLQFHVLLLTNILLVLISWLLVPKYGLLGGVALFGITNIVQMTLLGWIYRKQLSVMLI